VANGQGNITNDQDPGGSPFTRPGFLISAVLVALILVLGVIVAVRVAGNTDATTPPPASTSPAATSSATSSAPADPSASVCGLPAPGDAGPLTEAPASNWQYEGATAYPTSPEFGPAKTASAGYRFCFQHGQAGAVFATANALAVPGDSAARQAWVEYFVSFGPNRAKLLDELGSEPSSDPTGIRVRVVGFKVLSYTDTAARIDIAVEASGGAQTVTGSYVYELTWQDGDWKLNSDAPTPFNFSTIPNAAGYIPWSA
jgi:hypothetical protein